METSIITEFMVIPKMLGLADHGDYLEARLLHSHYDYLEHQKAFIFKLGVPIRGAGRVGRSYHGGKTICDFTGWAVVAKSGEDRRVVAVAFDAKRRDISKGSGWRWRCSQVPKHQRLALQMVEGWLGGWGFFLVSLESDGVLLNDVRVVRASQLQPGTSVDLRECPKVGLGLRGCDWLPVVAELFEKGV